MQANFLFPFLYIANILASFHSSGILDVFIDVSNIFCNGRQIFSDNSVSNLAPISSGPGDLLILSSFNVSNIMFSVTFSSSIANLMFTLGVLIQFFFYQSRLLLDTPVSVSLSGCKTVQIIFWLRLRFEASLDCGVQSDTRAVIG